MCKKRLIRLYFLAKKKVKFGKGNKQDHPTRFAPDQSMFRAVRAVRDESSGGRLE